MIGTLVTLLVSLLVMVVPELEGAEDTLVDVFLVVLMVLVSGYRLLRIVHQAQTEAHLHEVVEETVREVLAEQVPEQDSETLPFDTVTASSVKTDD